MRTPRLTAAFVLLAACGDDSGAPPFDSDTTGSPTTTDTPTTSTTDTTGVPTSSTSTTGTTGPDTGSTGEQSTGSTGAEPTFEGPFGSGSRLQARYLDGGGEAVAFREFLDTDLDMRCNFAETAPGEFHCVPTIASGFRFSDSDCTQPFIGGDSTPVGTLVRRGFQKTCSDPKVSTWSVGAVTTVAQSYRVSGGGACEPSIGNVTAQTLTPVPNDQLVAATPMVVGGGPLRARLLVGDDGSWVRTSLTDDQGQTCREIRLETSTRCIIEPTTGVGGSYFADAACTESTIASLPFNGTAVCPSQEPVYSVAFGGGDNCGNFFEVFGLGTELAEGDVYINLGSCGLVTDAPSDFRGGRFWPVGSTVAGDALPSITKTDVGTGAVTVEYVVDDSGDPLHHTPNIDLWRLEDGVQCTPGRTATGDWYCFGEPSIPLGFLDGAVLFADDTCTEPVVSQSNDCGPTSPHFRETNDDNEVIGLFEALEATTVYSNNGGCSATPMNPGFAYYYPGASIPLTTYPALMEVAAPN